MFKTFVTLQGVAEHLVTTCMLQNPDELHYMTTCVQGDNVKLKMVVDCGRLLLVCVAMQERCDSSVFAMSTSIWRHGYSEKGCVKACSLLIQFSSTWNSISMM